jgi:hypothetical protein
MNPLIQLKQTTAILLIALGLVCFGLLPKLQAVSPPPDGCYPSYTTATGCNTLFSLTTGSGNTGVGWYSLFSNTIGNFNTALGGGALILNIGSDNTATGAAALLLNTTGHDNTANGVDALVFNTSGEANVATGAFAMFNNTNGSENTASGFEALDSNTTGGENVAIGLGALFHNTTGSDNTANGVNALLSNTTGLNNTGIGFQALYGNSTGNSNTAIGDGAGISASTGSGNVYIGAGIGGVAGENNHTYIGNIFTTNVSGGGTDTVTVDLTTGLLGHLTSSRRYKENVRPMDNASEMLYRLKPVAYRYKKEIDPTQSPAFGLVAEEVADVNPALVARDAKGQPESVHYEMVNAMLLNEFLKEHKAFETEHHNVEKLQAAVANQEKQIETLILGLQRVTAQLQASKPASQVAVNEP